MSEGDGTAMNVHALRVGPERLLQGQRDGRERLVHLVQVGARPTSASTCTR